MKAPAAFGLICRHFVQDIELVSPTPEFAVDLALDSVTPADLKKLHTFLETVIGGSYSGKALQELWWSTSADIHFEDEAQLRSFLELMLERCARRLR